MIMSSISTETIRSKINQWSQNLRDFRRQRQKENIGIKDCEGVKDFPSLVFSRSRCTDNDSTIPFSRLNLQRCLEGHFGRVYCADWAFDSSRIASASQDGKIIIWNAIINQKDNYIPLDSYWSMFCRFEPQRSEVLLAGGLNNRCSLYAVDSDSSPHPLKVLSGHLGYVSDSKFIDNESVLTCSGDGCSVLWDLPTGSPIRRFEGHEADVMCLDICPSNRSLFVTGSVDTSCRLWDSRVSSRSGGVGMLMDQAPVDQHQFSFISHHSDVNAVQFLPQGTSFVSGSDDFSVRLHDLRSLSKLAIYREKTVLSPITAVAVSKSGRIIVSGHHDGVGRMWDLLAPEGSGLLSMEALESSRNPSVASRSMSSSSTLSTSTSTSMSTSLTTPSSPRFSTDQTCHISRESLRSVELLDTSNFSTSSKKGNMRPSTSSSATVTTTSSISTPKGSSMSSYVRVSQNNPYVPLDPGLGLHWSNAGGTMNVSSNSLSPKSPSQGKGSNSAPRNSWLVGQDRMGILGEGQRGHSSRISALSFSPDGEALLTSSWDATIKIWA